MWRHIHTHNPQVLFVLIFTFEQTVAANSAALLVHFVKLNSFFHNIALKIVHIPTFLSSLTDKKLSPWMMIDLI